MIVKNKFKFLSLSLLFFFMSSKIWAFGCGDSEEVKYFSLQNKTDKSLYFMFYNGINHLPEKTDYDLWNRGNFKLKAGQILLMCTGYSHMRASPVRHSILSSEDLLSDDSHSSTTQSCLDATENRYFCYGVTELETNKGYEFSFFEESSNILLDPDTVSLSHSMKILAKERATVIE